MAGTSSFNSPAKADFVMGSTEKKMDMTLDDIIKLTKKGGGKKRIPIKNRGKNVNSAGARAILQRSVAARSSKIRQGKLAEARARKGAGSLPATQAAGKRALSFPMTTRIRQRMMNSDISSRKQFKRHRAGLGPKLNFVSAAGNMKISVINERTKNVARRPTAFRRGPNIGKGQQLLGQGGVETDQMEVDFAARRKQKPRTLDSLFAQINEQWRNNAAQVVQPFTIMDRGSPRGAPFGARRR